MYKYYTAYSCKNQEFFEAVLRKEQAVNKTKIFPTILILLMTGAGVVYTIGKDPKMAIYYFAGAVLNAAITFL